MVGYAGVSISRHTDRRCALMERRTRPIAHAASPAHPLGRVIAGMAIRRRTDRIILPSAKMRLASSGVRLCFSGGVCRNWGTLKSLLFFDEGRRLKEILASISAPHFTAGIVLWDDKVIEAAPIVHYMKKGKWTRDRVREYCKTKKWKISIVHQMDR